MLTRRVKKKTKFKKIFEKLNSFLLIDFFKSCSIYDNKTLENNTISESSKIDDFEHKIDYKIKANKNHLYSNRLDSTCSALNSNVLAKIVLSSLVIKNDDTCSPRFKLCSLSFLNNTPNI